jgi:SAM-dependent methyltransferase
MAPSEHKQSPVANPFRPTVRRKLLLGLLIGGLVALIGIWSAVTAYRSWLEGQIDTRPPKRKTLNAPYIPSPQDVVDTMLEAADLDKDDVVFDLGCGDGRIVITAAKRYGCRGIGFEYDPKIAGLARANVAKEGLADLVTIEQRDIFTIEPAELNRASVITLYLLPWMNEKLRPQLERLASGKVILSHDWDLPGIEPDRVVRMDSQFDDSRVEHRIYVWTTPLKKVGKK